MVSAIIMTLAERICLLNQSMENKENIADFNSGDDVKGSPKPIGYAQRFLARQFDQLEQPTEKAKLRNKPMRKIVTRANSNNEYFKRNSLKAISYFGPAAAEQIKVTLTASDDDDKKLFSPPKAVVRCSSPDTNGKAMQTLAVRYDLIDKQFADMIDLDSVEGQFEIIISKLGPTDKLNVDDKFAEIYRRRNCKGPLGMIFIISPY